MAEEQRRACPVCGEVKTLRGLHGHLRLKHHKQEEEIMKLVSQAPLDQTDDIEETLNLLDVLKHSIARLDGLDVLEARGCFTSDEVAQSMLDYVREENGRIIALLADRGIDFHDDADIVAFCSGDVEAEDNQEGTEDEG